MSHLLVTGSLAYDRIAVFPDRFSRHILPDKIHRLNVSFLVEQMTVELGGTGGNIAYNLALLGEKPLLLGAVGEDFDLYESALLKAGISTQYLKRIPGKLTAHATIMTDLDDNQIASFYPGANAHAAEVSIDALKETVALVIIAPNDKKAMLNYAQSCRRRKVPFIADPGQAMPEFQKEELHELLQGALGLVANDYEWQLLREKTGLKKDALLQQIDWLIVTYAQEGAKVFLKEGEIKIPAEPAKTLVDPTGCGDAFRAGLLYGIKRGHSLKNSARIGAWIAARCAEKAGTQNHELDPGEWKKFLGRLNSSGHA